AYQQAGQHTEALELFHKLQEAIPAAGQHRSFRARVKKSEKALGHKESILPKMKFSWRRLVGAEHAGVPSVARAKLTWRGLAVAGAIALAVLGIMTIRNEYLRRHRTVYLVNAFNEPATVEVPGAGAVKMFRNVRKLVLPEGRY